MFTGPKRVCQVQSVRLSKLPALPWPVLLSILGSQLKARHSFVYCAQWLQGALKLLWLPKTGLDLPWLASESESESVWQSVWESPLESDRCIYGWWSLESHGPVCKSLETKITYCAHVRQLRDHLKPHPFSSSIAPELHSQSRGPAVGRYAMAMPCNFSQVTKWIASWLVGWTGWCT